MREGSRHAAGCGRGRRMEGEAAGGETSSLATGLATRIPFLQPAAVRISPLISFPPSRIRQRVSYLGVMPLIDPSDPRPLHFMGIAGAGMSALAELCARRGATGDRLRPGSFGRRRTLRRLGIAVSAGHDAAHVDGHRALVVSSAIPEGSSRDRARRRLGHPGHSPRGGARGGDCGRHARRDRRHARQVDHDGDDHRGARRRRGQSDGRRRRPRGARGRGT